MTRERKEKKRETINKARVKEHVTEWESETRPRNGGRRGVHERPMACVTEGLS